MRTSAHGSLCHRCNKPLTGGYIQAMGAGWHPDCWRCAACEKPLLGAFVERGARAYHSECHEERFGLRCGLCKELIHGTYFQHEGKTICERDYRTRLAPRCYYCDEVLLGTFKVNSYGQKACHRHEQGLRCVSCERWLDRQEWRLPALTEFGTVLCGQCQPRAIGAQEARAYDNAFGAAALQEVGLDLGAILPVPIRLDTAANLEALKGPLDKDVCGITQTEVTTVHGVESVRTVMGIVVVGGLAREHFESVLAHEFGHVWLFRERLDRQPPPLVEGFCELVRFGWLGRLATPLALDLQRRMLENPDPIYGDGLRLMRDHWEQAGVQGVRKHLAS